MKNNKKNDVSKRERERERERKGERKREREEERQTDKERERERVDDINKQMSTYWPWVIRFRLTDDVLKLLEKERKKTKQQKLLILWR